MAANNTTIEHADFPPLSPAGESQAPPDPRFVSDCLAGLDDIRGLGDVRPAADTLTVNKDWGVVFRVDFTVDGKSTPGFIDRLICWRQPNGAIAKTYALGQAIPALPSS